MYVYKKFIKENIAPAGVKKIGVYNSKNERLFGIPLDNLAKLTNKGKKLYSFGALSDVHIGEYTANSDFQTALQYLSNTTNFICICGDLVHDGTNAEQWESYKTLVDTCAKVSVYAIAGNHDGYSSNIENEISSYTGYPLYYSIEKGNDVFIFVGNRSNTSGELFTTAELQWLYETLEKNRNKRCFLFEHVRPDDACGNALGIYTYDCWNGKEAQVFESLLRHYKNTVFFHGHSHLEFNLQQYREEANIDKIFGCWSVHIPSISIPRSTESVVNPQRVELYSESEGYVVDVYEKGIHLRGRNFKNGKFNPFASYWLDTTLKTISQKSYTDSTGTINTL